jgi:hypothetical protein
LSGPNPNSLGLLFAAATLAAGMTLSSGAQETGIPAGGNLAAPTYASAQITPQISWDQSPVQQLLAFKDSEIKFDLQTLMNILRDGRHEGWVLAAYPDPKTGQPLIGAGLSLDLPERPHPQRDPLNSHPFVEPSSAQLWQAAGLKPEELQRILAEFNDHLAAWDKKGFRKRIKTLTPQIKEEDANQLLRVFAIQAVYNAKGYCRNFDQLTASQQMALSQLVYQMGVNLEEFRSFLNLINRDIGAEERAASAAENALSQDWKAVQLSLMESQWARLYRTRAVAVIAMLDPRYSESPASAEHSIAAVLHPPASRRHKVRSAGTLRNASLTGHATRRSRKKAKSLRAN